MTAHWDPERLLDIRGRPRFESGIQCHGKAHWGRSRCGWTKGGRDDEKLDVKNAENFLQSMAMKTPSDVTAGDLQYLAKLCLCRDHHQKQQEIDRVANEWAIIIEQARPAYSSATVVTASPVPVEASQLGTGWQSADWTLSAQVGSVVHDSVSRSTIGVQQQHPDVQDSLSSKNPTFGRGAERELAIPRKQLSALEVEELRKQLSQAIAEKQRVSEDKNRQLGTLREQHDALNDKVRKLESVIQQKDGELRRAREENSTLQDALRLAEARLSPETALSDNRRNGKMSGSWSRRVQGWLKKFRPRL